MGQLVNTVRFSVFAIAAALAATPALAASSDEIRQSVSVSYGDLDLGTKAGQSQLHARVRRASEQVCGYDASNRDLGSVTQQRKCMSDAVSAANVQIAAAIDGSGNGAKIAVADLPSRR